MLASKPPSSNITWTTADCLNLKGALPICQYPIFEIKDALPESQGIKEIFFFCPMKTILNSRNTALDDQNRKYNYNEGPVKSHISPTML